MNQRKSSAPIIELIEPGRYAFLGDNQSVTGGGVVIELSRRLTEADLRPCFSQVKPLGDLQRGDPNRPGVRYGVYLVNGPLIDVVRQGGRVGKDR